MTTNIPSDLPPGSRMISDSLEKVGVLSLSKKPVTTFVSLIQISTEHEC